MKLINEDALVSLPLLEPDSIDSLVTDPPAGIGFMGRGWDSGIDYIAQKKKIYAECLRVLKPGAHGLVWAIPRTSHWTASALEYAGFEIRDVITHIFGTGFPKSLDISKAIDRAAGLESIKGAPKPYTNQDIRSNNYDGAGGNRPRIQTYESLPNSTQAKQWQGFGTALKPASEHWILVRKPISEKTIAKNVLKHGTGGLNIDECRIGTEPQGRFPSNLILSHNENCNEICTEGCAVKMLDEQSGVLKSGGMQGKDYSNENEGIFTPGGRQVSECYGSKGGASRFFYCAKASKKDRNEGLEGMPEKQANIGDERPSGSMNKRLHGIENRKDVFSANFHPTVKSTKLMEYLIKLVTPPNGIVLDPFMGSGSTGVASKRLGFEFIGIEKESEYFEIAKRRIEAV